jgi:hypothetical protein
MLKARTWSLLWLVAYRNSGPGVAGHGPQVQWLLSLIPTSQAMVCSMLPQPQRIIMKATIGTPATERTERISIGSPVQLQPSTYFHKPTNAIFDSVFLGIAVIDPCQTTLVTRRRLLFT